jgi:hypothetical protein
MNLPELPFFIGWWHLVNAFLVWVILKFVGKVAVERDFY